MYRDDEDFKVFCGKLDGLAFLPTDEVQEGMQYLRANAPEGTADLLDYFDSTYVSGTFRRANPNGADKPGIRVRRIPPRFAPTGGTYTMQRSTTSHEQTINVKAGTIGSLI